jgi:catechol 2,3-dioxygenase-like lactoylglutathione lyase family enzyme
MKQRIALSTIVVGDYDEAIDFFVQKLGFLLVEDTFIEAENKRWVVVAPCGSSEAAMLLAKASSRDQVDVIGNQTGGRVAFFLYTDDFWRDYEAYRSKGIKFIRDPIEQSYGTVAVFEDICGNHWDLLEQTASH